ncbi:hypothetical protein MLD38_002049 [Melastoma candidum]|uniref:Uncharacterized protein n=1 Tax=Melastoma candidum TaxID=119954 RepID=A0ACB9SFA2_9MYRT|nr:hypothetical protein MLD38_002049 [Melastoma candidum]
MASGRNYSALLLRLRKSHGHFHKQLRCNFVATNDGRPSSRSFSSSSSKDGLLSWYLTMLETRPVVTKSATSSAIYAAADISSQEKDRASFVITSEDSFTWDFVRTLRMSVYGIAILGPSQHFWFNGIAQVLPKRDLVTTLKKIFLGQAIFGPINTSVFFSYNAALQGEDFGSIVARLRRDLLPTMRNSVAFWPACDFLTFKFVPVHLQPLVNSSFAYVWTVYLTYMASLKKAGEE